MKIYHLADLHLGRSLCGRDLTEDQREVLFQVAGRAAEEKPAALIIAGDVFDRAVPPPDALALFGEFVSALKAAVPDMVIAVIPGNHDSAPRLSFLSGVLGMAGVHIRADALDATTPVPVRVDGRSVRLWLLPFLTPGAFPVSPPQVRPGDKADEPDSRDPPGQGDLFASAAAEPAASGGVSLAPILRSQADLFAEAMARIEAARLELAGSDAPGVLDILVCHAFAAGGVSGDSERAFLGNAELVDAGLCSGFDYVALGHLHRPQTAGTRGRYPGSILPYTFADSGQERGFLSLEIDSGGIRDAFVALRPLRRMIRITCSFGQALDDPKWKEFEGDYIEAVLSDADAVLNPMEALKRRFPWLLSVCQESFRHTGGHGEESTQAPGGQEHETGTAPDFRAFFTEMRGSPPDGADEALFAELLGEVRLEAD